MAKLFAAVVFAVAVLAAPASAATITADASRITVTSGDEAEGFETYESATIDFTPKTGGAPLTAGAGCSQDGADVHCPKLPILANLGGGGDVASFSVSVTVEVHGGPGSDDIRSGANVDKIYGDEGDDNIEQEGGADIVDGGPGNDSIKAFASGQDIHGGPDTDSITFYGYPSGIQLSLDDVANDGPIGGTLNANVHSDVEDVQASPHDDVLVGNAGSQKLSGNDGRDNITGLGGVDELSGDAGDDEINSFDDVPDAVGCGDGNDHATIDSSDRPSDDCERVEIAGTDADRDGFKPPLDCDDNNPAAYPGANDIPGNGRDEDCNGADAPLLDVDKDGVTNPPDCDDNDPTRHQGARDIPKNGKDEDCDGKDAPYPLSQARISFAYSFVGGLRVTRFQVTRLPKKARVEVRCRGGGCPFRRKVIKVRRGRADARKHFSRSLRRGAVLEMRVRTPQSLGPVRRIVVRGPNQRPKVTDLCMAPGGRPSACPS